MELSPHDEPIPDALRRREGPAFAVLDGDLAVDAAEPRFMALCGKAAPCRMDRLPRDMEHTLRAILRQNSEGGAAIFSGFLLRATVLEGPQGRSTAVSLERIARRAPLRSAADRFGLTRREVAVLELILQGLCAKEIAERLQIARSTVGEYFKHLSAKVDAHTRAQLIARVLDY